ncbi:GPW/gp25 family protein [Massilia sp. BJB1822]|uniref:GPW/gp25 family protein n=1 Tax=Massilia sp. BJB1822 TaxID=2744470 RepID=UPI0015944993|nr:GPW/gp25 family protein [Massilia sp. BJB1822]NVD97972.1 GPW/gp25 family protein [Massilia sp. BJB1822]
MNPADSAPRPFLGQGLRFPLEVAGGRLALSRGERKIEESIRLILGTARGERLMRPELGCGVHDLVFAPGSSATEMRVTDAVRQALVLYEPRIDVLDVAAASPDGTPHVLLIRIAYRIRENNAVSNLVYPYFITEGV